MSKKAVLEFIKQAAKDKDLRKQIQQRVEDIVKLGKAHGHAFSRKEFAEVLRGRWQGGEGSQPNFCGCYVCYEDKEPKPKTPKPKTPAKKKK